MITLQCISSVFVRLRCHSRKSSHPNMPSDCAPRLIPTAGEHLHKTPPYLTTGVPLPNAGYTLGRTFVYPVWESTINRERANVATSVFSLQPTDPETARSRQRIRKQRGSFQVIIPPLTYISRYFHTRFCFGHFFLIHPLKCQAWQRWYPEAANTYMHHQTQTYLDHTDSFTRKIDIRKSKSTL
jgi:hypothetical protein